MTSMDERAQSGERQPPRRRLRASKLAQSFVVAAVVLIVVTLLGQAFGLIPHAPKLRSPAAMNGATSR